MSIRRISQHTAITVLPNGVLGASHFDMRCLCHEKTGTGDASGAGEEEGDVSEVVATPIRIIIS
jgi:hypothetical protein